MIRLGRWWMRHRGLWWLHVPIHRLVVDCPLCRAVWASVEADPRSVERLDAGIADMDAGRWYHYDTKTGESTQNPDWPQDGPQLGDSTETGTDDPWLVRR